MEAAVRSSIPRAGHRRALRHRALPHAHEAVGPISGEAVAEWERTGWRTFHWEPWFAGLAAERGPLCSPKPSPGPPRCGWPSSGGSIPLPEIGGVDDRGAARRRARFDSRAAANFGWHCPRNGEARVKPPGASNRWRWSRWPAVVRAGPGPRNSRFWLWPPGSDLPPDQCPPVSSVCGRIVVLHGTVDITADLLLKAVDLVVDTVDAVVGARLSDWGRSCRVRHPTAEPLPVAHPRCPQVVRRGLWPPWHPASRLRSGGSPPQPATDGGSCSWRCDRGSGPGCPRGSERGPGPVGRSPRPPVRRTGRRGGRPRWRRRLRMGLDRGLDLLGKDLLATRVDRCRAPPMDGDGAVGLDRSEIAGDRPAHALPIRREGRLCLLAVLVVPDGNSARAGQPPDPPVPRGRGDPTARQAPRCRRSSRTVVPKRRPRRLPGPRSHSIRTCP